MARRLTPRATQPNKGGTLRISSSLQIAYANAWADLVREMRDELVTTVKANFAQPVAMDARESVWERLLRRYTDKFATAATSLAHNMVGRLDKNADRSLQRSIRDVAGDFTLNPKQSPNVQAAINESIRESVYYIKRIPVEFLEGVRKGVTESIAKGGNGLQDLEPIMLEKYGEARRHAKNVALDQTRKAYTAITTAKMEDAGITKFEWVHTGGSQEPREYHKHVLNGQIFSIDNPPVIDKRTGERGLPGQAIFCRCTMRPIVTFDFED